jgi:hypothetical protein
MLHVGSSLPLPVYFDGRASCLTLNRIKDSPEVPTLTSAFTGSMGMTVELCVDFCKNKIYAGVENGTDVTAAYILSIYLDLFGFI